MNRTQNTSHPTDGTFDSETDIVCLGCHNKPGWGTSAHSHSLVANETYTNTAAIQREFPNGIQVWQASCLNCHDTHTVVGANMLLREGTDSTATPKVAGKAAQEETCYQCHDINGGLNNALVGGGGNQVPDIKTQFNLTYAKPITNADQGVIDEQHTIINADFIEPASNLGNNRHAECTDCHNPHRIIKNQLFNADPTIPDAAAHHVHDHDVRNAPTHTNIISGALAGTWGVEPNYGGNTAWGSNPISFDVKSGYAAPGASTHVDSSYVTREYQICLKCHSNYAYGNSPPTTGPSIGINGVTQYTNQAMEFQAPDGDKGEAARGVNISGAAANHRSWHPVIEETGRTLAKRGIHGTNADIFNPPWQEYFTINPPRTGVQTMYCSDCHGSSSLYVEGDAATHNVNPAPDGAWGPHGSDNAFILKGNWDTQAEKTAGSELCFRCHDVNAYSPPSGATVNTGSAFPHVAHSSILGRLRCTWCHVAVPHGWRNKALLVDIWNDPEAASCRDEPSEVNAVEGWIQKECNAEPYYQNAYLGGNTGGVNWKPSGEWVASDCNSGGGGGGGGGGMGGGGGGMGGACNSGRWMVAVCGSPL